jgi:hypothetical protein
MRGHSRGAWWGTLEDIVDSEEEAEYWAVFGVTHRGNKHCLGEFQTKLAALSAIRGMSFPRSARQTKSAKVHRRQSADQTKYAPAGLRKIVQIEVAYDQKVNQMVELIGLCDDGTVWRRSIGNRSRSGREDQYWEQISLDELDNDQVRLAFGFGATGQQHRT